MTPTEKNLLIGGIAAAIVYAVTRTQKGEAVAVDVVESIVRAGGAVASALTPRGIRNNNPGNIEWIADPVKRWRGMVSKDGRFGVFDSPANGIRAIGGELRASIRKGHTIEQAIHEWAPPTENDTGAYVAAVAKAIGEPKTSRLAPSMLPAAALAIIKHENGVQPYNTADVAAWVNS